jgi:hypothetical protein
MHIIKSPAADIACCFAIQFTNLKLFIDLYNVLSLNKCCLLDGFAIAESVCEKGMNNLVKHVAAEI